MLKKVQQMKHGDEQGFTLIELLIVIAIIAILAAIALPQFAAYRERGVRATMISDARNAVSQLEGTFADCQAYPTAAALVNGPNTVPAAVGICTAGNITLTLSSGNTGVIAAAAGANGGTNGYSITITNTNAGAGYSPLLFNGGGAVTPACQWTNGNPC